MINIYNGKKCIRLSNDFKKCSDHKKLTNSYKQFYIHSDINNKEKDSSDYKYCCDTTNCKCSDGDKYHYSRITSVIYLNKDDNSNLLKQKSMSSKLSSHYIVSQGIYGTTDGNNIDASYINMSGSISNIYKNNNDIYLYNSLISKEKDAFKKKDDLT